jgi:GH25 family lysozyme M1 (1,4-beta-N-acetylmuramidase)
VIVFLCLILSVTLIAVFADSYSKRYDPEEFSELQTYLLEIKERDRNIYNKLKVKEIKKEVNGIDVSSWQKEIDWEQLDKVAQL